MLKCESVNERTLPKTGVGFFLERREREMSSSECSFKVELPTSQEKVNALTLLAALLRLSRLAKHVWGPMEEELREAAGLNKDEFNRALSDLLVSDKCIQHRFSQEGTAGPIAHRYWVAQGLTITVTWSDAEKK